jgi:hypothetical protein
MTNLEEIKKDQRLKLLVLSSISFSIPVFPGQAAITLTWLQQEVLLDLRQSLMSGKRELPTWYQEALHATDTTPSIQITDLPQFQITDTTEVAPEEQFDPVPRPVVFHGSEEWVKES